jgi:hypothetical protein
MRRRSFIKAIQSLYYSNKYDQSKMMTKIHIEGIPFLEDCSSSKQYLRKLEEMYNYQETNEENIVRFC